MDYSTDLPHMPYRRLKKNFSGSTKAIGTSAPNTLNTNAPRISDAMGITPQSGILNFFHDGTSQNITVHYWCQRRNNLDATKGWIAGGEGASINTKQVDPESNASFKCPPNVPYFLQAATSTINNVWVHDAGPYKGNLNSDDTDA